MIRDTKSFWETGSNCVCMNWGEMTENILELENDEEKYFTLVYVFLLLYCGDSDNSYFRQDTSPKSLLTLTFRRKVLLCREYLKCSLGL